MTERQGLFPPELRNGSEHFLRCSGDPVTCIWVGRGWMIPGYTTLRTSDDLMADGWTYLGPAPTYEQAQADAADARRFRWLAEKSIPFFNGFQLHLESEELDIRAAIDASMKENGYTPMAIAPTGIDERKFDHRVYLAARAIARVHYPNITDAELDRPAQRWNGTELADAAGLVWHDFVLEAEAALAAIDAAMKEKGDG